MPFSIIAAACSSADAIWDFHQPVGGDHALLGIGAERADIGDAVAGFDGVDPLARLDHHARASLPGMSGRPAGGG